MKSPQNVQRKITPVILAGGEGRRLRPLTSPDRPKPFLKLGSKYSLLQHTILRVRDSKTFTPPILILHNKFEREGEVSLRELGVGGRIIAEPENRSTAVAIALASFVLESEDTVMAVMPSDHYVQSAKVLQDALVKATQNEALTSIGVRPSSASTRYGYIQAQGGVIEHFIEKPPLAVARKLVQQGECYWNTGMFTCAPKLFLELIKRHAPDVYESAKEAYQKREEKGAFILPDKQAYAKAPAVAIDYALMEKLENARLVGLDTAWHDIGCWPSLLNVKLGQLKLGKRARREYG